MTTPDDPRRLDEFFGRSGTGPLTGILVADLGRVLAGPYCTMLLADMGATVVKIESPAGDETRSWRPPVHEGESTYYLSVNRNKHAIVLDLRDDADLEVARDIVRRADVVVENFKPGGLAPFGLDHPTVAQGNPAVVYASISGFGWEAGAELPGYDLLVQAVSGMMDLTGNPGGEPFRSGVAVFDVVTGLHAALGIVAALHHRDRTGEGQHLRLSLLGSALSGLVNQSGAHAIAGVVPHRMGNAHPSIYPYEPLPTADGQLVLAVGNDRQFGRLCEALDLAGLPADLRFETNEERSAHRDELRPLLVTALAARSAEAWHELLSPLGVPCAPILDVAGGVALADRLGLEPVVTAGGTAGIRHPVDFAATPATYDHAPPALGADGARVREWLAATDAPRHGETGE